MTVPIRGMHCASCEILIGGSLQKVPGVTQVSVSQKKGLAHITYTGERPADILIGKAVEEAGYAVGQKEKAPWLSRNIRDYEDLMKAALFVLIAYVLLRSFGLFSLSVNPKNIGGATALLMGLVAGFSTCMALVGGLVLGLSARHADLHPEATARQKFRPHLFFNIGRILGYTVLGGAIGWIGGIVRPGAGVIGALTLIAALAMIIIGGKLVEIFPALKDRSLALPSGIAKRFGLGNDVREYSHRGSLMLGAMTFFVPCGFTQAMQLYAISSGSALTGSILLGLFALGTAPGLLGIGGLAAVVKGQFARRFFMGAGVVVIVLGIFNARNGWELVTGRALLIPAQSQNMSLAKTSVVQNGEQIIRATYTRRVDIVPSQFRVQAGKPVRFDVDVQENGSGCMSTIMVPGLYDDPILLKKGRPLTMRFTPKKKGVYDITCAMGVPRGSILVE